MTEVLPSWLPQKTINLGLDLQGGSHLLLDVGVDVVIKERADGLLQAARTDLKEAKIKGLKPALIEHGIKVSVPDDSQVSAVKKVLRNIDPDTELVSKDGVLTLTFTDVGIKKIKDQTIGQSIEIVRRRVDETGTREPAIQRQGDSRIIVQLPGVEDPGRIKDILGKTAKLTFHLVAEKSEERSIGVKQLPHADFPGDKMPVKRRAILTGDMLVNAQPSFQDGGPVVSFRLNSVGAKRFCKITRENTKKPFAIVLDGVVVSAPTIQNPICGGSAVITGRFTVQETSDLSLLLRAGALPAPLKILEERTVGPSLGADSVAAGKVASLFGLGFVIVFMVVMYGLFGLFADIALVVNIALIFSILSVLQATLTLPGIAGIVLTVGMAVDANVLIFERIKEELLQGRSILSSIDAGYSRAMSTIVDSNLTTLIAAIILYSLGTGPIKGFAVTLGVGIVTSFFSAIMVTRLIVVFYMNKRKPEELPL
jgi:preprotein translocase subunit SecD